MRDFRCGPVSWLLVPNLEIPAECVTPDDSVRNRYQASRNGQRGRAHSMLSDLQCGA